MLRGPFRIKIIAIQPPKALNDIDNLPKGLMDFCQQAGIIENDRLCVDLHILWGTKEEAPDGARLLIEPG